MLARVVSGQQRPEKAIADLKRDKRFGSNDRRSVAWMMYECVRFWRRYSDDQPWGESVGQNAVLHALGRLILHRGVVWPDWWAQEVEPVSRDGMTNARWWSIPDSINEIGRKQYGDNWEQVLEWSNKEKPVGVWHNPLRTTEEAFKRLLDAKQVDYRRCEGLGWLLHGRPEFTKWSEYKSGWFEIQDLGSQAIGLAVAPRQGEFIVDACAGSGGKTLQMAVLAENKAKILSMDVVPWKLKNLQYRASKCGIRGVEIKVVDPWTELSQDLSGKADAVLVDAPCSGSGVWDRMPHTKYLCNPDLIRKMAGLQLEVLQKYSRLVSSEGRLIYATCSIFEQENEAVVHRFLQSPAGSGFKLDSYRNILPGADNNGFYQAKLIRKTV